MEAIQNSPRTLYVQALELLLKPIAQFCIRRSLHVQDFISIAKRVFIEVATAEMRKSSTKANLSRLSVMTGLHRNEIRRLTVDDTELPLAPASILGRVMGQWEQDRRFRDEAGVPKLLSFGEAESEFARLVESVSRTVKPGAVLFELERNRAVERTPRGLKFLRPTIIAGDAEQAGYRLLSHDIAALTLAVEGNLERSEYGPHLHVRTSADNIFIKDLPEVREWIIKRGKQFHKEVREYLALHDKDLSADRPFEDQGGGTVALTSFALCLPPNAGAGF